MIIFLLTVSHLLRVGWCAGYVHCVASGEAHTLVSCGEDGAVKLWDPRFSFLHSISCLKFDGDQTQFFVLMEQAGINNCLHVMAHLYLISTVGSSEI